MIKYLVLHTIVFLFAILLFSSAFFQTINNLLTDQLQGQIEPREEIVIVAIDDRSLQSIGAWEWNRDIFAKAMTNISNADPIVIGIDVLFLENREGDNELQQYLETTKTKVVFSSKLVDEDILNPVEEFKAADTGFVNFNPDSDGIIRKNSSFTLKDEKCELSFALSIVKNYFRITDTESLCKNPITVRKNEYKLIENNDLVFSYSKNQFKKISFVDVYNNNFDENFFKDKIVLIGSTALDLRSNLNDNFTDVFGETTPGVVIHANVVNSFLNNSFLYPIDRTLAILILFLVLNILLLVFKRIKNSFVDFAIYFVCLIIVNLFGIVLFEFNKIFPFLLINLLLTTTYLYSVIFKYYTQGVESAFVKKAFGQYINPLLLGQILEKPELLKLGGETKEMTVLFSDIRSFTTISEGLTPETLIQMLNDYLEYMSDIIIKNKGTIDKYIGDAIMAIWSAPIHDDSHEENAVKAALEMLDSVANFNKIHADEYPKINIGVGLNTGKMVVGNVGGAKRFDYTVLGDNVNLGSRLEGLTKKYGIGLIVTKPTKNGVKDDSVIFRIIDEVKVKGKNKPVKIYQPIWNNATNKAMFDRFEGAFQKYQEGNFDEAVKVLKELKNDSVSQMYLDRIKNLTKEQKEDWNGVWTWEEK